MTASQQVSPPTIEAPPGLRRMKAIATSLLVIAAIVFLIAKRAEADDVTIPELAALIGKDAPLAAKLVRMSNSSMFNLTISRSFQ